MEGRQRRPDTERLQAVMQFGPNFQKQIQEPTTKGWPLYEKEHTRHKKLQEPMREECSIAAGMHDIEH